MKIIFPLNIEINVEALCWLSNERKPLKVKVGDKVQILRKDIFHLRRRKNVIGKITSIDGSLIMVKPQYCKWEIELYPNEVRLIT